MSTTKTPKLESSTNYFLFDSHVEQRDIKPKHVKRLVKSMSENGFFPSKPLQVIKAGSRFKIVDGHHRFAAAKSLEIPFFYVIESASSNNAMSVVNAAVCPWAITDFVRQFASRGISDYVELLKYTEKGIPLGMAASMLINNSAASGNAQQSIKAGTFKIITTAIIDKVIQVIDSFGTQNPVAKHRAFIGALSDCILTPEFEFDRFFRRFSENPLMLCKASNKDLQLDQIEELYNFRSRDKVALAFIVRANAARRNAFTPKSN